MLKKTSYLQNAVSSFSDAALVFSEENRFYLTGFHASDGCLLVAGADSVFFTDSRYIEAAQKALGKENVRDSRNLYDELSAIFAKNGITNVAIEDDRLTVADLNILSEHLPFVEFNATPALSTTIDLLRSVKDEAEKENIIAAQRIAEKAFDHILDIIIPGMTEKEIALELDFFMLKNGAQALSFETIAVSGINSSMPHGVPGNKKIEKGDFITMDFGAVVNGYHSDMTRTVIVGQPDAKQKEIYNIVLEAQLAALAKLCDGVSCKDADSAARDVITNAGYGDFFGHGTGHGVGVEIHEKPNLSMRSRQILKTGNVVTVEPGIYLPDFFGVRIEDMAYITANGAENLTKSPKGLIIV